MIFRQVWLVLFILCASTFARAQERPDTREWAEPAATAVVASPQRSAQVGPAARQDREGGGPPTWYGWQTLMADGAAFALLFGGLEVRNGGQGPLLATGAATYVAGGPMIHFVHQRVDMGIASVGLRVGLPFIGAAIGGAAQKCANHPDDVCGLFGELVGLTVGMLSAAIMDGALLAYESPRKNDGASWRVGPLVTLEAKRATVGVGGTF